MTTNEKIIMSLVDLLYMVCDFELSLYYRLNYLELIILLCNEHNISRYDEEIDAINRSCEKLMK